VNGGDGNDTAALNGNKADYSIVHNADGSVTVTGHGATDKLVSIEHIQFNDQTVDLTAAPPRPRRLRPRRQSCRSTTSAWLKATTAR